MIALSPQIPKFCAPPPVLLSLMAHELHRFQRGIESVHPYDPSWIIEKVTEFQKSICFIDYTKAFDCVDHNKLWKILKEMRISDHLTCLLRNLYAGHEATIRTRHGTMNWLQTWKGVCQGCIWSPCLFRFHTKYIMWNPGLGEAQAGIKIAGRNINNLRCTNDTTLMAESKEELKSLLMKVKEES